MEEKLESYRLRKRRSETIQSIKEKFAKVMSFVATSPSVGNTEKPPTHIDITVTKINWSNGKSIKIILDILTPFHRTEFWSIGRHCIRDVIRLWHKWTSTEECLISLVTVMDHILHLACVFPRVGDTFRNRTGAAVWRCLFHAFVLSRHLPESTRQEKKLERDKRI